MQCEVRTPQGCLWANVRRFRHPRNGSVIRSAAVGLDSPDHASRFSARVCLTTGIASQYTPSTWLSATIEPRSVEIWLSPRWPFVSLNAYDDRDYPDD